MSKQAMTLSMVCLALAAGATAGAADTAATGALKARWESHTLDLNYMGFTTHYSCDGIEDKVGEILRTLGARKDLRVRASDCSEPMGGPSRFVRVTGQFQTLVPAPDAAGPDLVAAHWQPLELRANRPFGMGEGDCELFEQLQPQLQKAFPGSELNYKTRCMPYQLSMGSWNISGRVLRAEQP